jgi:hypothetical protein
MCHPGENVDPPLRPGAVRHEVEIATRSGESLPARLALPKGLAQGRIGTLGFCLGGNLVLHMAARRADLATVSYYAFPAGLPAPKAVPSITDFSPGSTIPKLRATRRATPSFAFEP